MSRPVSIGDRAILGILGANALALAVALILAMPLGGAGGALLFGGLKTAADVVMHVVEHRWLQGRAQTKTPA